MKNNITLAGVLALLAALIFIPSSQPDVKSIHIVWANNYENSNEITIVFSSTNLTTPLSNWVAIAATRDGEIRIPETNSQCFFVIANFDTNTMEMSALGGSK